MALKTHRQGNDFKLTLQVYRLNNAVSITNDTVPEGAVIEDLTDAQNIKLSLFCSTGACTILKKTVNVNVLVAEIPANIQAVGTYYVLLEYDKVDITLEDGLKHFTTDFDAFKIVDKSAYADTEGDMSLIGVIKVGLDGKSSYQYAQEHGYTGTEEEFGQLQYESTLAAINEAERILAENARVLAENQRESNEYSRGIAENGRVLAESERVIGYDQMNDRIDGLQSDITWLRDATVIFTINYNNELICNIPNGMTDSYELTENGELILTY